MEHRISDVRAVRPYVIEVAFEDDSRAEIDLGPFFSWGEVTEPFRDDPALFMAGPTIEGGGGWISWPVEVDIDADALWYKAHPEDLVRDFGPEVAAE